MDTGNVLCKFQMRIAGIIELEFPASYSQLRDQGASGFRKIVEESLAKKNRRIAGFFENYHAEHYHGKEKGAARYWHIDDGGTYESIFICSISNRPGGVSNTQIMRTARFALPEKVDTMNCRAVDAHVRQLKQPKFIINTVDAYVYEIGGTTVHREQISKAHGERVFLRYWDNG